MKYGSAVALALLLFYSILTLWVPERWALSFFQAGVFVLGIAWAARLLICDFRPNHDAWPGRGGTLRSTREKPAGRLVSPVPLRGSFCLIPLAGAVAWGLLQLLLGTTVYRFVTWNAVLYWTTAFVLVSVSLHVLSDAGIRRSFLRALLWFGFALSVISVIQLFTSEGKVFWLFQTRYKDQVLGPFVYYNNYAAFVELLLPLALVEALRDRHRALLYTVVAGAMYASVIASTSRAGSLLVTLEIAAVLLLAAGRGMISRRNVAMVLVFASIFTFVVGWQALWKRFGQPDPYIHRREMLLSSLAMARERPWFGFGLGTFQTAYPAYALFDIGLIVNHAHNDWAEWLAEGGAPFFLLMLSVAAWSVRPAIRTLWGIGVLSVFLHALVDYPMQRLGLAAWLFVMVGALAASEQSAVGSRSSAVENHL